MGKLRPDFSGLRTLDLSTAKDLMRCVEVATRNALPAIHEALACAKS